VVTKGFCATIYADATLTVRDGQRAWQNFSDFRLYVTDDACTSDGNTTNLTLTP
jgi:hypothetical protein